MAGNSQKTFNLLPIQYDEDGKLVKIIGGYSDPLLTKEVEAVNKLASDIDEYGFDVPPLPLLPGKSGRIKMTEGPCEAGNEACQQGKYPEAIGLYTKAIEEVQARPQWENAGMLQDRLQLLFKARSQACLLNKDWPEAVVDANLSIRFNANENAEAYKTKAHCLLEMDRLDEARDTLLDASKIGYHHASEPSFMEMLKEMEKLIDERSEKDAI